MRLCCLSCDVELEKDHQSIDGLEKIVELISKRACTFFVIPENITRKTKKLLSKPHFELGLHVHWKGSYENGLQSLPEQCIESQLSKEMKKFRKHFPKPVSFRGGGLCQTSDCIKILAKHGFRIDSSMAAKLNEKSGWHQGHSKLGYDEWFYNNEILEIPVTRFMPSGREWYPYTMSPESPLLGMLIKWKNLASVYRNVLITPIFHSWGEGRLKGDVFIEKLEKMIKKLEKNRYQFITMSDFMKRVS